MLIGAESFISEVIEGRIVVITGYLGCGKTLLGYEIAEKFLRMGYRLISNNASVWRDNLNDIECTKKGINTVILLDEGGWYIRTAKTISRLITFSGKIDCIWIIPGKKAPHLDVCDLTVELLFDFQKNFLIPIKLWRYTVQGARRYGGTFVQAFPQEYYGIYDTLDPGDYPEDILEAFDGYTKKFYSFFGKSYKTDQLSDLVQKDTTQEDIVQDMEKITRVISISGKQKRGGKK